MRTRSSVALSHHNPTILTLKVRFRVRQIHRDRRQGTSAEARSNDDEFIARVLLVKKVIELAKKFAGDRTVTLTESKITLESVFHRAVRVKDCGSVCQVWLSPERLNCRKIPDIKTRC
ncbi:hypothetical protein PROFUN_11664 [Planoprotostelium fungivorum]|uniref:Uncharacterized protein n=1 Tax=Planoprotostelium fungivorum TaxID=1890364 RepID=A0A2P6N592_9EUKA|nr:hypothetical protein PROFUN_11664 [Planoprotostelium fungivorum]